MAAAVFNYQTWAAMFPYLNGVPEVTANGFFTVAELLFANDDCSPIADPDKRLVYLNYIVAHLARLAGYPVGAGGSAAPDGMVGRVSSATEGTVSISADYGKVRESQAWWVQTQEGATFWQITAPFRTARYIPAPPRYFGPARRGLVGGIWRQ
jgi:hypothetical protein